MNCLISLITLWRTDCGKSLPKEMSSEYFAKKITKTKAKKRAYDAFSIYLRTFWTQKGYVPCYTCGKHLVLKGKPGERVMVGHWVEGHRDTTYVVEDYVRPQCYHCNIMMGGLQGEFRDRIRKELGHELVDKLLIDAKRNLNLTAQEYLDRAAYYKEKLRLLTNN